MAAPQMPPVPQAPDAVHELVVTLAMEVLEMFHFCKVPMHVRNISVGLLARLGESGDGFSPAQMREFVDQEWMKATAKQA